MVFPYSLWDGLGPSVFSALPFLAGKPLPRRVTTLARGMICPKGTNHAGEVHKGCFSAFFPLCPFVSLVVEKRFSLKTVDPFFLME
jgi:hypothetical protein